MDALATASMGLTSTATLDSIDITVPSSSISLPISRLIEDEKNGQVQFLMTDHLDMPSWKAAQLSPIKSKKRRLKGADIAESQSVGPYKRSKDSHEGSSKSTKKAVQTKLTSPAKSIRIVCSTDHAKKASAHQPQISDQVTNDTPVTFETLMEELKEALDKSRRVVVITGAGISVAAGIPDFRSSTGIFAQLIGESASSSSTLGNVATSPQKAKSGYRKVITGRDLFDSSVFGDEPIHSMHLRLLADLQTKADQAEPTPVHRLIQHLHRSGKLLRCYTQNIDGLEVGNVDSTNDPITMGVQGVRQRMGSESGSLFDLSVPSTQETVSASNCIDDKDRDLDPIRYPTPEASQGSMTEDEEAVRTLDPFETPRKKSHASVYLGTPRSTPRAGTKRLLWDKLKKEDTDHYDSDSSLSSLSDNDLTRTIHLATTSKKAMKEAAERKRSSRVRFEMVYPAVVPLHGQIGPLKCLNCRAQFSLSRNHIESMHRGEPIPCPTCFDAETKRTLEGNRSRGVGTLRSSVVLYNEDHPDAERIGEISQRDLCGRGRERADLLLVIGTSLKIPGTRKLVKEFASVIRGRDIASKPEDKGAALDLERSLSLDEKRSAPTAKNFFINLDMPTCLGPLRRAFDRCILGDAQEVARRLLADQKM